MLLDRVSATNRFAEDLVSGTATWLIDSGRNARSDIKMRNLSVASAVAIIRLITLPSPQRIGRDERSNPSVFRSILNSIDRV